MKRLAAVLLLTTLASACGDDRVANNDITQIDPNAPRTCETCGDIEKTSSALTSSQVWSSPNSSTFVLFNSAWYTCDGATWTVREPMAQYYSYGGVWGSHWSTKPDGETSQTIDYSKNEVQLYCYGNYVIDDDVGTSLQNKAGSTMSCSIFSHRQNQWWTFAVNSVTVTAVQYAPKSASFPNGYWNLYIVRDTSSGGTTDGVGCYLASGNAFWLSVY